MPTSESGLWYPEDWEKPTEPEESEQIPAVLPRLEIETPEGTLVLTPENTVVRTFKIGDGEFDHIIHTPVGSEKSVAIFLNGEDPAMREHIEGHPYTTYEDEQPDDEVYGYFAAAVVKGMGNTLDPE